MRRRVHARAQTHGPADDVAVAREFAGQRLVYHCNSRRTHIVRQSKSPSAQKRYAQQIEIIERDSATQRLGFHTWLRGRDITYVDLIIIATEWDVRCGGHGRHARNGLS